MKPETALFVVPTPIGNLEDITLRAIKVLQSVDVILAEDTRTTGVLLKHLQISKPLQSYHIHNEHQKIQQIIDFLQSGKKMALVSDAGTPSISDPGFLVVRACVEAGIAIECLAGATAFVPALVCAGLPSDKFVFEGFLPHKKGRQTRLKQLAGEDRTFILYESPFRLLKCLAELIEVCGGERKASVSRELSKLHEETIRGSLSEIYDYFKAKTIKGEIVIVVAGSY